MKASANDKHGDNWADLSKASTAACISNDIFVSARVPGGVIVLSVDVLSDLVGEGRYRS